MEGEGKIFLQIDNLKGLLGIRRIVNMPMHVLKFCRGKGEVDERVNVNV